MSEARTLSDGRRRCARCERFLPATAFRANPRLRDGLDSWCRECFVARTKRWRAENPAYTGAYNTSRRALIIEKSCICGRTFTTSRHATLYCELHRGKRGPGRATRLLAHRRRHAVVAAGETIRLVDVYARDHGVCWICERPVEAELRFPDPLSASIDHVTSLKLGGRHKLSNVRVAHLRCNVRRGTGTLRAQHRGHPVTADGIRAGADSPMTTRANVAPAFRCEHPCGHGLEAWLIGTKLQAWHREGDSTDAGDEVLTECDAPPATTRRRR